MNSELITDSEISQLLANYRGLPAPERKETVRAKILRLHGDKFKGTVFDKDRESKR